MKKSPNDIYEILHQIGRGSYASVHKAINRRTGEIVAIKKIPMANEFDNLKNEIGILSDCECKNIVRFLDSACSGDSVSIVMEFCSGGSVKDVMKKLNRTITQEQIIVITKDVLNGLDYLHKKNKIHRDVKAANILLNSDGVAKLGDFGVSEPLDASTRKQSMIGTLLWLPPELLNGDCNYSPVIDIWSLGITIIEMAEGQPPYSDKGQEVALKEIKNLAKDSPTFRDPSKWSADLNEFLSLCLDKDASRRKSAHELLNHDIIEDCNSNEIIKNLVAEVDSILFNGDETDRNLFNKSLCLLKENEILFNIYHERDMTVVRVDQLTHSLRSLNKEFDKLLDKIKNKDTNISDMIAQSKSMLSEIFKLEGEKADLESKLRVLNHRKSYFINQLSVIRRKLKEFENYETMRRKKLSSLKN